MTPKRSQEGHWIDDVRDDVARDDDIEVTIDLFEIFEGMRDNADSAFCCDPRRCSIYLDAMQFASAGKHAQQFSCIAPHVKDVDEAAVLDTLANEPQVLTTQIRLPHLNRTAPVQVGIGRLIVDRVAKCEVAYPAFPQRTTHQGSRVHSTGEFMDVR